MINILHCGAMTWVQVKVLALDEIDDEILCAYFRILYEGVLIGSSL